MGDGSDKFAALLKSVDAQTSPAKEVIIVIPYEANCSTVLSDWINTPLPGGGEKRLIRSKKGMISQRLVGIEAASGENLLILDDDLEFEPNLVESLDTFKTANDLDCVLPFCGKATPDSITKFPLRQLVIRGFTGLFFTSKKESSYIDVVTCTAGHKVFTSCRFLEYCYKVQTGCFQIFYINANVAKNIHFEEDLYLEQGTLFQYAAYDDMTFFYKAFLKGYNTGYALRCYYTHLDASAGHKARTNIEAKCIRHYSTARARLIFWYKYVLNGKKIAANGRPYFTKFEAILGALYGFTNYSILAIIVCIAPQYWSAIYALFKGYYDAINVIRRH